MYKLNCISEFGYTIKVTTKYFNSFVKLVKYIQKFTFYYTRVESFCADRRLNLKVSQKPVIYF